MVPYYDRPYVLALLLWTVSMVVSGTFLADNADAYDKGAFGRVPLSRYQSTNLTSYNLLRRSGNDAQCLSEDFVFLGGSNEVTKDNRAQIIDSQGDLVWTQTGGMVDFRAQSYRGELYLTAQSSHYSESVAYVMLDKHYQVFKTIVPPGDYGLDLHEFKITEEGTALLIRTERLELDLTPYGGPPKGGTFQDGIIQEIDIETNDVLFEWHLSHHLSLEASYIRFDAHQSRPGSAELPIWDFAHMNSVDKDSKGNYLVSLRHCHVLLYVSGTTGEILWQLGGKNSSFSDLSLGNATNFKWQHDARWRDNEQTITMFDNHVWNFDLHAGLSRALKLRLDQEAMTVEVVTSITHPQNYHTQSAGSVMELSNGHVFVGYGYVAAFTEFSHDGSEVVCDWQYAALHTRMNGLFSPGSAGSYRTHRGAWKGYPLSPPDTVMTNGSLFVSWNGATEYKRWELSGLLREGHSSRWTSIVETERHGFESNMALDDDMNHFERLRLKAYDVNQKILGEWEMTSSGVLMSSTNPDSSASASGIAVQIGTVIMTICILGLCVLFSRRLRVRSLSRYMYRDQSPRWMLNEKSSEPLLCEDITTEP